MNVAHLYREGLARFGDGDVVTFEGRTWTRAEQADRAGRLATVLRGLGVRPGDRVAVVLPNTPDVGVAYDAITRIGGAVMPVLFVLTPAEIGRLCAHGRPVAVLTAPELAGGVTAGVADLPDPPIVLVAGDDALEAQLAAADPDTSIEDRAADDVAVLAYTSGTTGTPKGVVLTHANLLAEVDMTAAIFSYTPEDRSLGVLPMAHVFGLVGSLAAQRFGFPGVLHRWFSPDAWLEAVQEHRVTTTSAVPTMLTLILNAAAFAGTDLSSLRTVVVGAAPLPLELADEWERRTGSAIVEGYGMTETAAGIVIQRPGEPRRPGSCGRPYPGCEVRVLDDRGGEVPPGTTGELVVRGPQVTPGYWEAPEETAAAFADGWLRTGDVGHVDAEGYVYVTERKKDLVIRGGLNISPRDVEEVLHAHPAVAEVGVVGRPDPTTGERVVACVVLRPGATATAEELTAHCAARLARYKVPEEIRFLDALPRTLVGKILKRDLRTLVSGPA